jgi:ketosteroid isomerase-like protein
MSRENVEIVREGYAQRAITRRFDAESAWPDFVWDMSNFRGWPEQQTYEGVEGANAFLCEWIGAWDHWEVEAEAFHSAGDKVVAIMHQRGQSKATGARVDMHYAQVWTLDEGKLTRMEMYSDQSEALKAVGLEE